MKKFCTFFGNSQFQISLIFRMSIMMLWLDTGHCFAMKAVYTHGISSMLLRNELYDLHSMLFNFVVTHETKEYPSQWKDTQGLPGPLTTKNVIRRHACRVAVVGLTQYILEISAFGLSLTPKMLSVVLSILWQCFL